MVHMFNEVSKSFIRLGKNLLVLHFLFLGYFYCIYDTFMQTLSLLQGNIHIKLEFLVIIDKLFCVLTWVKVTICKLFYFVVQICHFLYLLSALIEDFREN